MPLVTRTAALVAGLCLCCCAEARAQQPSYGAAQAQSSYARYAPQPEQQPTTPAENPPRPIHVGHQLPWTGGGTKENPGPPRLLPTAYQAPVASEETASQPITPANTARPLPLSPQGGPASPLGGKDLSPIATAAASLGIVLGLFILVVWSVRRGMPKGAGLLPSEAVEVLGRAPLAGRQNVHLVRCGNKIILVSVSPSGVETLTEITDPEQVHRLQEICQSTTTPAGALQQFLGRFGAISQPAVPQSLSTDQLDFRHLETGSYPRA